MNHLVSLKHLVIHITPLSNALRGFHEFVLYPMDNLFLVERQYLINYQIHSCEFTFTFAKFSLFSHEIVFDMNSSTDVYSRPNSLFAFDPSYRCP